MGTNLGNRAETNNSAEKVKWPIALRSAKTGPGTSTPSCKFTEILSNLSEGRLFTLSVHGLSM